MTSDTFVAFLIALIVPMIIVFLSGINGLRRSDERLRENYWRLREKYPRSYVKQSREIKFVRKCFQMETKEKIHWVECIVHYLQIVVALQPLFMLVTFIFVPTKEVAFLFLIFGFCIPFGVSVILYETFFAVQTIRGVRIRKDCKKQFKK